MTSEERKILKEEAYIQKYNEKKDFVLQVGIEADNFIPTIEEIKEKMGNALSKNLNFLIWINETACPETDEERERLKKIDELIREILIKKININYIKRDTIQ